MSNDSPVSMGKCKIIAKTSKAILFSTPDFGDKWIPEFAIHYDSDLYINKAIGEEGELIINESWLDKI